MLENSWLCHPIAVGLPTRKPSETSSSPLAQGNPAAAAYAPCATTRLGRRRRSPITHGSALVAFERNRLALAPLISSRRKYWLPRLDMPPNRFLPSVEFCRGTRPSGHRHKCLDRDRHLRFQHVGHDDTTRDLLFV